MGGALGGAALGGGLGGLLGLAVDAHDFGGGLVGGGVGAVIGFIGGALANDFLDVGGALLTLAIPSTIVGGLAEGLAFGALTTLGGATLGGLAGAILSPGIIAPILGTIGGSIAGLLMPGPGVGALIGALNSTGLKLLAATIAGIDPIKGIGIPLAGAALGGLTGAAVGGIDLWRLANPAEAIIGTVVGGILGGFGGLAAGATLGLPLGMVGLGLGNTMDEVIQAGLTRGDNAPAKPAASVADFM